MHRTHLLFHRQQLDTLLTVKIQHQKGILKHQPKARQRYDEK